MLGTNITEKKIREILKYLKPKKIVLALDGDTAGRKGIKKFIENTYNSDSFRLNMATDFYVYGVPDGYDIDKLIQESPDEFYKRLKEAKPVVEYFLDYKVKEYDLNDVPSKGRYITEALGIISTINNFSEEDYLKALSEKTGVSVSSLKSKLLALQVNVMYKNTDTYEKGFLRYIIGNPDREKQLEKEIGFEIKDILSDNGLRVFVKDFSGMQAKIMYMSVMEEECIPFKEAISFGQWLAIFKLYSMLRQYNELSEVSKNILSQKTNGHMDTVSSLFSRLISERMRENEL
jgi:DNA primase